MTKHDDRVTCAAHTIYEISLPVNLCREPLVLKLSNFLVLSFHLLFVIFMLLFLIFLVFVFQVSGKMKNPKIKRKKKKQNKKEKNKNQSWYKKKSK